jgi:hypothetical protein
LTELLLIDRAFVDPALDDSSLTELALIDQAFIDPAPNLFEKF